MGNHRDQAQFDRSRWRLALLIPMWLAQLCLLLGLMGIFAYRLAETVDHYDEDDKRGQIPVVLVVWESTNIGLSLLSLVLTIIEVARHAAETLTPGLMLVSHILKLTCALAILGLDIVVYINRSDGNWSTVGLAIDCALIPAVLVPFVYAILVLRRLAATDDYHHPANAKHYGYGGADETAYHSTTAFVTAAAPFSVHLEDSASRGATATDRFPAFPGSSTTNLPGAAGDASARDLTGGGLSGAAAPGAASTAGKNAMPMPLERLTSTSSNSSRTSLGSYSHERDTQFDSYVASKGQALKLEADRVMGAEFGWASPAAAGSGNAATAGAGANPRISTGAGTGSGTLPGLGAFRSNSTASSAGGASPVGASRRDSSASIVLGTGTVAGGVVGSPMIVSTSGGASGGRSRGDSVGSNRASVVGWHDGSISAGAGPGAGLGLGLGAVPEGVEPDEGARAAAAGAPPMERSASADSVVSAVSSAGSAAVLGTATVVGAGVRASTTTVRPAAAAAEHHVAPGKASRPENEAAESLLRADDELH